MTIPPIHSLQGTTSSAPTTNSQQRQAVEATSFRLPIQQLPAGTQLSGTVVRAQTLSESNIQQLITQAAKTAQNTSGAPTTPNPASSHTSVLNALKNTLEQKNTLTLYSVKVTSIQPTNTTNASAQTNALGRFIGSQVAIFSLSPLTQQSTVTLQVRADKQVQLVTAQPLTETTGAKAPSNQTTVNATPNTPPTTTPSTTTNLIKNANTSVLTTTTVDGAKPSATPAVNTPNKIPVPTATPLLNPKNIDTRLVLEGLKNYAETEKPLTALFRALENQFRLQTKAPPAPSARPTPNAHLTPDTTGTNTTSTNNTTANNKTTAASNTQQATPSEAPLTLSAENTKKLIAALRNNSFSPNQLSHTPQLKQALLHSGGMLENHLKLSPLQAEKKPLFQQIGEMTPSKSPTTLNTNANKAGLMSLSGLEKLFTQTLSKALHLPNTSSLTDILRANAEKIDDQPKDLKALLLGWHNNLSGSTPETPTPQTTRQQDQLFKLFQQAIGQQAPPAHPMTTTSNTSSAAAKALENALFSGIARITSLQLRHLLASQQDSAPSVQGGLFELPIRIGEQYLPLIIHIQHSPYEEDTPEKDKNTTNKGNEKRTRWHVFLEFDLDEEDQDEWGHFACDIDVIDSHVNTRFWIEKAKVWQLSRHHLNELQHALEDAGITVDEMTCQQGNAPSHASDKANNLHHTLVDIKT